MQSGITASEEVRAAFQSLAINSQDRGLTVTISTSPESLVPENVVPSTSADFFADLSNLSPLLVDDRAAFVILRCRHDGNEKLDGSFTAITFVPDAAPVRQKMLFASTRLTLVRELGPQHFSATLFATSKDELTAEGWKRHEAHGSLSAPLTAEEQNLKGIKEAEAQESTGTSARKSHVSSGVNLPFADDVLAALTRLRVGEETLVQLHIDVSKEMIVLGSTNSSTSLSPASLRGQISKHQPQYSFYRHISNSASDDSIIFIYSCPAASKIKERMLYASSRSTIIALAEQESGVKVAKKIEISEPSELEEITLLDGLEHDESRHLAPSIGDKKAFSKPKRPGKR